jgi:hypothetical protein
MPVLDDNQIRYFISEIQKKSDKIDYNELKYLCNSTLTNIPISIIDFKNKPFDFKQREYSGRNVIFRARARTPVDNIFPSKVSEISFIPEEGKDKIKEFGRFNKPKEPMFYGSLNYATACAEAVSKGNPFVFFKSNGSILITVGVWEFTSHLTLARIPYSEKYFLELHKIMPHDSSILGLETIKTINKKLKDDFGSDIGFDILTFFADECSKFNKVEDFNYKLSNYYSDRIFNKINEYQLSEKIDGIRYPSVVLSYEEDNIVFTPDVIESKLKFINAFEVWMVTGDRINFYPTRKRATTDNLGNLVWSGINRKSR